MKRRKKLWIKEIFQWFIQRVRRFINKPNSIFQSTSGNHNQTIARMSGGTAIANVEKLIQNFNLPPQEVLSLKLFWKNWSQETNPPFSPSLVIGGRYQERDRILKWLRGIPSPLTLQGDSPEEAIAFLAAVIQDLEKKERNKILSRAVVVDGATSWQNIIKSSNPLILIARLKKPEGIGRAIQQGHHVFVPSERVSSGSDNLLPRIVRDTAEQALKEMGLSNKEARRFATLARRSLSALRRKLAIAPDIQQPAWAKPDKARVLLAPLLVSAWDNTCAGDRDALSRLSNMPYESLEHDLVRWANESEPPLRRVGNIWMIAAQEDAWRLIGRYLSDNDLKRFEDVALDVLSELDPAFELPPEQRFAAAIYEKVLSRSKYLRNGISEMLALMATLSSDISFNANQTGEDVANRIVWQLMEIAKDNETLWATLASQLPLLAEAAPGILLDAINTGLAGEKPILVSIFQDRASNTSFTSSSPHTGLLWALETLAWNPDYLSQAALNLARLTRLDPGGNLGNRPARSLRDIFICWHPNTTASLQSCLRVLDTIRKHEPLVAWNLLMSLLPKLHSGVFPTHGTKWRDWVPNPRTPITFQEYVETTNAILKRLISDADGNITRWCSLIISITGLTTTQQEILIGYLEALDPKDFSTEERLQMCAGLREKIVSHRQYSDAEWAISTEFVKRLETVLNRFEPDNLVDRHLWLFKHGVRLLEKPNASWQERESIVGDLRKDALWEILNLQGWGGVIQLAQQAQEPSLVGTTLARAELLPIDLGLFLRENFWSHERWRREIARSYVSVSASSQGEKWIQDCLNANFHVWSEEEYGEFLLCLPFNGYLLDRLEDSTPEVRSCFWSRVQEINRFGSDHVNRVFPYLLEFDRPHLTINLIEWNLKKTPELFSPEQIAKVLEASVRTDPGQNFDVSSFAYQSAELMNYLEKTNISCDHLVNLELIYFRIHKHYRRPRLLYDELAKNPDLFIEALQCIFRAENESAVGESNESNPPNSSVGELAWHLLENWKQMPGVLEDGSVDVDALRSWVTRVRELAFSCSRSKVADIYIGYSLAFSPIDPDGAFPHQAVRNLLEELANPTIEEHWRCQIINNRGVTSRSLTVGGGQERTLVEQYEEYVRQIRDQWPRTAAVLRKIADNYRQQASGEDIRAELTQDFWR